MGSDEVLLIARVRRAMPRNADVLAVCDLAERNVTAAPSVPLQAEIPAERNVTACPVCAARREADARRVRAHRAKRRGGA